MNFSSLIFLFFFFPIFLCVYNLIPNKYKKLVILIFSLIFYLYSGLYNFLIIIFISFINYLSTILINKYIKKDFYYYILVFLNIIALLLFKYSKNLTFPLGISFYIFNSISYIIDVQRKKISVEKNIINYFCYIMLFTHVTIGPITRYNSIYDDLQSINITSNDFTEGFRRFLNGLIKKVIISDNLGLLFTTLLEHQNTSIVLNIYILIVFALELYIDFSSYSDMAIGIGQMIGIHYKENFDFPYSSTSVSEFWRRWHISLGEFFKEYVYFPLGGSKKGTLRCIINILIVWFLTGIWHGNTINFLLWGIYYGFIIIIEKFLLKDILNKASDFIKHIYVLVIVLFGYIFFINVDIIPFIKTFFNSKWIDNTAIFFMKENIVLVLIGILLCLKFPDKLRKKYKINNILVPVIYVLLFIIVIAYIISGSFKPFLYNNF